MGMRKVTMYTANDDQVTRIVSEKEAARLGKEPSREGSNILSTRDVPADPVEMEDDRW